MNAAAGLRPSLVGKWNERQILRAIQSRGPMSRAEVVRCLGLSAPTVSKAIASLLATGLLEETAAPVSARGRPAPILRPAVERAQVLGVVVDGDTSSVIAAGLDGTPIREEAESFATPGSYDALLDRLEAACRRRMARAGVATFGIGVSLPGLVDDRNGLGVFSPNLPITNDRTPAADLARRLDLDAVLIQECHALALAEKHYGGAVKLGHFAVVDIGIGVGLAVMNHGRLLKGHAGMAGELGHLTVTMRGGERCGCGNTGCLETIVGDPATARRIGAVLGRTVTIDEAFAAIRAEPTRFAEVLDEIAETLAVGLAAAINLFNPGTMFLHSRLLKADPNFLAVLHARTAERSLAPSFADAVLLPALGTKSRGAVAGIIRHLTNAVAEGLD